MPIIQLPSIRELNVKIVVAGVGFQIIYKKRNLSLACSEEGVMRVLKLFCRRCGHQGLIIKEFLILSVIAHCQKCGERHYFDKDEIRDWFEAE